MKNEQEELQLLLRSRFPIIVVETARPLAVVRAEEVAALRQWARERTVPAD